MKKRALFALLSLSALGLSACEDDPTFNFTFQSSALEQAPNPARPDTVSDAGAGLVSIVRYTSAPCFDDRLRGEGRQSGSQLTLTVTRVAASPCANEQDRHFRYQAIYADLRPGTYQLRVTEEIDGTPQVVKDTSVVVD